MCPVGVPWEVAQTLRMAWCLLVATKMDLFSPDFHAVLLKFLLNQESLN